MTLLRRLLGFEARVSLNADTDDVLKAAGRGHWLKYDSLEPIYQFPRGSTGEEQNHSLCVSIFNAADLRVAMVPSYFKGHNSQPAFCSFPLALATVNSETCYF